MQIKIHDKTSSNCIRLKKGRYEWYENTNASSLYRYDIVKKILGKIFNYLQ